MTKFILLYRGGAPPESPEEVEKVLGAWGEWMGAQGAALVDGGAPFGEKAFLGGGADTGLNGYSLYEAADLAVGGSVEIAECADMSK
jgi:hypothetical protein